MSIFHSHSHPRPRPSPVLTVLLPRLLCVRVPGLGRMGAAGGRGGGGAVLAVQCGSVPSCPLCPRMPVSLSVMFRATESPRKTQPREGPGGSWLTRSFQGKTVGGGGGPPHSIL